MYQENKNCIAWNEAEHRNTVQGDKIIEEEMEMEEGRKRAIRTK